jgi:hypothetical protein
MTAQKEMQEVLHKHDRVVIINQNHEFFDFEGHVSKIHGNMVRVKLDGRGKTSVSIEDLAKIF